MTLGCRASDIGAYMRISLLAIAFLACAACGKPAAVSSAGGAAPQDPAPTTLPEEPGGETPIEAPMTVDEMQRRSREEIDEQACAADGGEIRQEGMLGMYRCVRPYADAGKACRSNADCEGRCLAPDGPATGEDAEGRCQANDSPFGCYAEVEEGKVAAAICVD